MTDAEKIAALRAGQNASARAKAQERRIYEGYINEIIAKGFYPMPTIGYGVDGLYNATHKLSELRFVKPL